MKPVWRKSHTIFFHCFASSQLPSMYTVAFLLFSFTIYKQQSTNISSVFFFVVVLLRTCIYILVPHLMQSALLVVDNPSSQFRTIQDIKECKIPDTDFCISAGDGVDFYWNATIRPQYVIYSTLIPVHFFCLFTSFSIYIFFDMIFFIFLFCFCYFLLVS